MVYISTQTKFYLNKLYLKFYQMEMFSSYFETLHKANELEAMFDLLIIWILNYKYRYI